MGKRRVISLLMFSALAIPYVVSAHAFGASFEQQADEYLIDIGYDPATPFENDRFLMEFELLEEETMVDFTSVWVRLEYEDATMLATGIAKPPFGPTTLLFELPAPGSYILHARFEREGDRLAEASFPFTVQKEPSWEGWSEWLYGSGGLILGVAIAFFLKGWRRRDRTDADGTI